MAGEPMTKEFGLNSGAFAKRGDDSAMRSGRDRDVEAGMDRGLRDVCATR